MGLGVRLHWPDGQLVANCLLTINLIIDLLLFTVGDCLTLSRSSSSSVRWKYVEKYPHLHLKCFQKFDSRQLIQKRAPEAGGKSSASAEGARVRRRRKASAASLSPEAQEIPRSGIESLLLWPNSYRLQVTLPVKIGYAPSRRSNDLLPNLTQHAAI